MGFNSKGNLYKVTYSENKDTIVSIYVVARDLKQLVSFLEVENIPEPTEIRLVQGDIVVAD